MKAYQISMNSNRADVKHYFLSECFVLKLGLIRKVIHLVLETLGDGINCLQLSLLNNDRKIPKVLEKELAPGGSDLSPGRAVCGVRSETSFSPVLTLLLQILKPTVREFSSNKAPGLIHK